MKQALLVFAVVLATSLKLYSQVCVPQWTEPGSGIYPDTIQNMPPAAVNVPYDITVQFKVPKTDSSIVSTGIDVDHVELVNVEGLEAIPSSVPFHFNCNPSSCSFKADSTGCVRIQGTPNQVGVYSLTISSKVYITPVVFLPVDFSGYEIIVNETIGVSNISQSKFDVSQNSPNPANGKTLIYTNLPYAAMIELKISNVIGNEVYKTTYTGKRGLNKIYFDCASFAPGIYFYSVSDGKNSLTRRMIVEKK